MQIVQVGLRAFQLLWIFLLTVLLGNVIATAHNDLLVSNAAVNFSMFVTVVAWLAALYGLAVTFVAALAIPLAVLTADAVAVLFTFIDGIVLGALLGSRNCGRLHGRAGNLEKKCRELQASTTFMWFTFAAFVATLVLAGLAFRRGGGAATRRAPMKQVQVDA